MECDTCVAMSLRRHYGYKASIHFGVLSGPFWTLTSISWCGSGSCSVLEWIGHAWPSLRPGHDGKRPSEHTYLTNCEVGEAGSISATITALFAIVCIRTTEFTTEFR